MENVPEILELKKPWNFCNNFFWNNVRKSLEIEESLRKSPPLSLLLSLQEWKR
jgi:hypothetical protein